MTPRQIDKRRLRALAPSVPARGMQQIGTAPGFPPRPGVTQPPSGALPPAPGDAPPKGTAPPPAARFPGGAA